MFLLEKEIPEDLAICDLIAVWQQLFGGRTSCLPQSPPLRNVLHWLSSFDSVTFLASEGIASRSPKQHDLEGPFWL